jgi:hypothetical protein
MTLPIIEMLAVLSAAFFAGAAIYINAVEHPARMGFSTQVAATWWAPSYKRATIMQAPLALAGLAFGIAAWLLGAGVAWLCGALLIGSVVPFTFLGIMPTNRRLLDPARDLTSAETRSLLTSWGRLHAIRSAASVVASLVFLADLALRA